MAQVDVNLQMAETAVQRAKNAMARQKDAVARLPEARKLGNKLKREYERLEREARKAIAAEAQAEHNVTQAFGALQKHEMQQPVDLPSDAELAAWQKRKEELEQLLAECGATKRAAVGEATSARLKVVHASNELARVRGHYKTLVRLANGEDPNDSSWNLLGSGDDAPPMTF